MPGGSDAPEVDLRRSLWKEATEIIVDTTWTARSFQVAAGRWANVSLILGLPASVIATVTAAGAGAAALFLRTPTITAVLALIAAGLGGVKVALKPEEAYQGYTAKGSAYLALRNDTRHFRDIRLRLAEPTLVELESELKALNGRLNALLQQPPMRAPTWAYNRAKRGVEAGESDYVGDHFWEDSPF